MADVLAGLREPYELAPELHDLWRDGFHTGAARMRAQRDQAEAVADYWYLRANHSPAAIREMRLKCMDDAWRAYWDAGMPTDHDPATTEMATKSPSRDREAVAHV